MQDVIRSNRKTTGGKESVDWRILLVDQLSMRMVSACCKMHEIAAEGITCKLSSTWFHFSSPNWILCTVVEDLNKKREPIPSMEAIYLITPCDSSVRGLMNDFQSPSRAKYKCCHIYFTEGSIQKKNCLEKKKEWLFIEKKNPIHFGSLCGRIVQWNLQASGVEIYQDFEGNQHCFPPLRVSGLLISVMLSEVLN